MTPLISILGGAAILLCAYVLLLIRNEHGEHRTGEHNTWELIKRLEEEQFISSMTTAPGIMQRGGYDGRHTLHAVLNTGEIPVVARPLGTPGATLFTHNPPRAICA